MASRELKQYGAYLKAWYELTDSDEPLAEATFIVPQEVYDEWVDNVDGFEQGPSRASDDYVPSPEIVLGDTPTVEAQSGTTDVSLP